MTFFLIHVSVAKTVMPRTFLFCDRLKSFIKACFATGFYGMYTIALLLKAEVMRMIAEYVSPAQYR